MALTPERAEVLSKSALRRQAEVLSLQKRSHQKFVHSVVPVRVSVRAALCALVIFGSCQIASCLLILLYGAEIATWVVLAGIGVVIVGLWIVLSRRFDFVNKRVLRDPPAALYPVNAIEAAVLVAGVSVVCSGWIAPRLLRVVGAVLQ
jgi:hypothetical protein